MDRQAKKSLSKWFRKDNKRAAYSNIIRYGRFN